MFQDRQTENFSAYRLSFMRAFPTRGPLRTNSLVAMTFAIYILLFLKTLLAAAQRNGRRAQRALTLCGCLCGVTLLVSALPAQDWPQILGPKRNGISEQHKSIAAQWPPQADVAWQIGLGSGFGGSAIVGDRVYTLHRLGNQELLEATELSNGRNVWRCAWPASYRPSISPDNGPRCVPTIVDDKAICYGAAGDLVCVDCTSGKIVWQRALRKETQADDGYFGAGSSPLVVGDLVVVCLGGKQAGVVGIDLKSGTTRWSATGYDASYAAPVAVNDTQALVVTRLNTVLLRLADGQVLGDVRFGSRGPTVNAATPIPLGNQRFLLTASYGVGATLLSVADSQLSEVFSGDDTLSSQYNTPVAVGSRVIGIDGREDVGVASLQSMEIADDKISIVWRQPQFGTAHLLRAASDQIIVLSLDGGLFLLDGQADQFQPLAKSQLPAGTYRALPALSASRLVVRSSDESSGRSQLICIKLP